MLLQLKIRVHTLIKKRKVPFQNLVIKYSNFHFIQLNIQVDIKSQRKCANSNIYHGLHK